MDLDLYIYHPRSGRESKKHELVCLALMIALIELANDIDRVLYGSRTKDLVYAFKPAITDWLIVGEWSGVLLLENFHLPQSL